MKIIQPKVELWRQGEDVKAHVARCARICYKRETGNDEATYMRLINSHHWSMFRHETVYAMVPALAWQGAFGMAINKYIESPYIKWEQCSCLKGIRLEDVTPELESKAYEELKNNKH